MPTKVTFKKPSGTKVKIKGLTRQVEGGLPSSPTLTPAKDLSETLVTVPKESTKREKGTFNYGDARFRETGKLEAANTIPLQDELAKLPPAVKGILEIGAEAVDATLNAGWDGYIPSIGDIGRAVGLDVPRELIPDNIRTREEQGVEDAITILGDLVGGVGLEKATAKGLIKIGTSLTDQMAKKVGQLKTMSRTINTERAAIDFVNKNEIKAVLAADDMVKAMKHVNGKDAWQMANASEIIYAAANKPANTAKQLMKKFKTEKGVKIKYGKKSGFDSEQLSYTYIPDDPDHISRTWEFSGARKKVPTKKGVINVKLEGEERLKLYKENKERLRKALRYDPKSEGKYVWMDFDGQRVLIQNTKEDLALARKSMFDFINEQEKLVDFKWDLANAIRGKKSMLARDLLPNNVSYKLLDDATDFQRYAHPGLARDSFRKALNIGDGTEGRIINNLTNGKKNSWGQLSSGERNSLNDTYMELKREAVYGTNGNWDYPEFNVGKWGRLWHSKQTGAVNLGHRFLPINRVINKLEQTPLKTHSNVQTKLIDANQGYREEFAFEAQRLEAILKGRKLRKESGEVISEMLEGKSVNNRVTLKDGRKLDLTDDEMDVYKWLQKEYGETDLIEQQYKIANYNPRIAERFDDDIIRVMDMDSETQKNVRFFAEYQRKEGETEYLRDALELYRMFVGKGLRKKYFSEPIKEINKHTNLVHKKYGSTVSKAYSEFIKHDVHRYLGLPSANDYKIARAVSSVSSKVPFFEGVDESKILDYGRKLMDVVYMNGLANPKLAIRNLHQSMLTVADIGYRDFAAGASHLLDKNTWRELENRGVFANLKAEWLNDYRNLTGRSAGGYLNKAWDMSKNASMWMFDKSDKVNRVIAYKAGENKITRYITEYGADSKKVDQLISKLDPTYKRDIQKLIQQGNIEEAVNQYSKRIADRTQFMYSAEGSPLLTRSIAGKFAGQFLTWTGNYSGLLTEWWKNDKGALMRHTANSLGAILIYDSIGFDSSIIPATSPYTSVARQGLGAFQSPFIRTASNTAKLMASAAGDMSDPEADWKGTKRIADELFTRNLPMFIPGQFLFKAVNEINKAKSPVDLLIKPKKTKKKKTIKLKY